jgi:cell division inhibitor SulA
MNELSAEDRKRIVAALAEGNSMRAVIRVAKSHSYDVKHIASDYFDEE